ncbi:MAG: hypothetical protein ACOCV1_01655 [Bacillota bacterium]
MKNIRKKHIIKIEMNSPTSNSWLKRIIVQAIQKELKNTTAIKSIK